VLPPDVPQYFIPLRGVAPAGATLTYVPAVVGCAVVHFADKAGNQQEQQTCRLATLDRDPAAAPDWTAAAALDLESSDLEREPAPDRATYIDPPASATKAKNFAAWNKSFADALFRTSTIDLLSAPALKLTANTGRIGA
jgi:hypothetical protein